MASPTIEFRNALTPFAVITSLALTGTGPGGAIPLGSSSSVATVRVYNNFASVGSIADALACTLSCYDDATHQGQATTTPVTNLYLYVEVNDYNGGTTGQDVAFFAIGGLTKHAVPTNSGTISGTGTNYITVNIKAVVPVNNSIPSITQGLWLEYSSSS